MSSTQTDSGSHITNMPMTNNLYLSKISRKLEKLNPEYAGLNYVWN